MTAILWLMALCLLARGAGAQYLIQYTPPGGPTEKPESRRAELEHQIAEARYQLGPVHIAPWFSVHDVAYVRGLFLSGVNLPNDVTATAGAGFRAYLRNGSKAIWSAQALPEYVWWQHQAGRRQVNGHYSLAYAGFFNHLTLEVKAGRDQQQAIVTPEVPVPVSSRLDGAEILAELRLSGAFSLFTALAADRQSNLVRGTGEPGLLDLSLLDRDEQTERVGARWHPDRRWSVALGAEHSVVDFKHQGALDRSNSGTAPVTEIRFKGNFITVEADAADRSLEARTNAEFVPFHEVTGNASVTLGKEGGTADVVLYSNRNLVYSLSPGYAYLVDQRLGTALLLALGLRAHGRLFVETGRNDYTAFSATAPRRREDVLSYGGSLYITLRRELRLEIVGLRSRYDSNLPGADRSYTSVGATITLAGF